MEKATVQSVAPAEGDLSTPAGFTRWVEPHWQAMARLAARYSPDAEDILQDALVVAWRKRGQFDPSRGSARNWLLAITADQRRKTWRRLTRVRFAAVELTPAQPDATPSLDAAIDLRRALHRLPSREALAIDLHYYLGLGVADVAAVMRCPEGTVKSLLSRARARLRTILGKDYR